MASDRAQIQINRFLNDSRANFKMSAEFEKIMAAPVEEKSGSLWIIDEDILKDTCAKFPALYNFAHLNGKFSTKPLTIE